MISKAIGIRALGFLASFFLTIAAYLIIAHPTVIPFRIRNDAITIISLAFLQALVQLICFIDVWKERGPRWNFFVFASTLGIIFVIVFFSIWIMYHLNCNMMP